MGDFALPARLCADMALPMKKPPAMKAKAMKVKRVSMITKGKMGRAQVLYGTQEKTAAGHTKDQLMRNKRGKFVSKKANAVRRKLFEKSKLKVWTGCITAAHKAMSLKGFVAINGRQAEGKALYAKANFLKTHPASTGCYVVVRGRPPVFCARGCHCTHSAASVGFL